MGEKPAPRDGREVAVAEQTSIMRLLFRYGWLRTKDLACLTGNAASKTAPKAGPSLQRPTAGRADIRRTQRHLATLKELKLVLMSEAPNGSWIYALSEKGARALQGLGLQASTGKDLLRHYHAAFFLHRNISNEIAISASLQGFRVSTEREIAQGKWQGGTEGIHGKRPDVAVWSGKDLWFIEVERSHRNRKDYEHLKSFLSKVWKGCRVGEPADLAGGNQLRQVVFVCTPGFKRKLSKDFLEFGWSVEELAVRVKFETSLYSFKDIMFY